MLGHQDQAAPSTPIGPQTQGVLGTQVRKAGPEPHQLSVLTMLCRWFSLPSGQRRLAPAWGFLPTLSPSKTGAVGVGDQGCLGEEAGIISASSPT